MTDKCRDSDVTLVVIRTKLEAMHEDICEIKTDNKGYGKRITQIETSQRWMTRIGGAIYGITIGLVGGVLGWLWSKIGG